MKTKHLLITAVLAAAILCSGAVKVQAIDPQGLIAQLQAQIQALMQQIAALQAQQGTTATWCHTFNTNLRVGDTDNNGDVSALAATLVKENLFQGTLGGTDQQVTLTEELASSVVAFQEKYASDILIPSGLKHGTGYVGPATRKKLNVLYGCGIITTPPPIPTPTPTTIPSPTPTPTTTSNWQTYTNDQAGFSIQYPIIDASLKIISSNEAIITLPIAEKGMNTNINGKTLNIKVSPQNNDSACVGSDYYSGIVGNVVSETSNVVINGIQFTKGAGREGAMGQGYTYVDYTTSRNGFCITMAFTVKSWNDLQIPAYNGGKPFTPYDFSKEEVLINQIMSTFKFTSISTQPSITPQGATVASGGTLTLNLSVSSANYDQMRLSINCPSGVSATAASNQEECNRSRDLSASANQYVLHFTNTSTEKKMVDFKLWPINKSPYTYLLADGTATNAWIEPAITQPSITVTSPNGSEVYAVGSQGINYSWSANYIVANQQMPISVLDSSDNVIYTRNLSYDVNLPAGSYTPSSAGGFTMTGTTLSAGKYRVKVCDAIANVCGFSAYFTVGANSPKITVTSPKGGETYTAGQIMNITWSTQNLTSASGKLYIGYSSLKQYSKGIATVSSSSSSYQWTIPSDLPGGDQSFSINIACYDCAGGPNNMVFGGSSGGYIQIVAPTVSPTPAPAAVNSNASQSNLASISDAVAKIAQEVKDMMNR